MKKYGLVLLVFTLLTSCIDTSTDIDDPIDYSEQNEIEILAYIADNDLNAEKSDSGLYYVIDELGTGEQPIATSNVTVAYKGYFTDGVVFDESTAEGVSFNLQQVIYGWTEGITYFKEGGSGVLLVPAHLGYGSADYGGIPGGSVLVFDINLISID